MDCLVEYKTKNGYFKEISVLGNDAQAAYRKQNGHVPGPPRGGPRYPDGKWEPEATKFLLKKFGNKRRGEACKQVKRLALQIASIGAEGLPVITVEIAQAAFHETQAPGEQEQRRMP
jgi:hypothetical protein